MVNTHQNAIDALNARGRCSLSALATPFSVAFVTCSYDTAFENIADQVAGRIDQLIDALGTKGPVQWHVWVVDDLCPQQGFTDAVHSGFARHRELQQTGRLHCISMTGQLPRDGGLKGRAVLDGMVAAMAHHPYDAFVYINLNLKVDLRCIGTGLSPVLSGAFDAAIGSRAQRDGGIVIGAGRLGRIKSRVYSRIARTALPPIGTFLDTNAPLKIFSARAAAYLTERALIDQVTLDCEWLMIMQEGHFSMLKFPIAWVQREGSKPPWHLIFLCLRDVYRIRRNWLDGVYR